MKHVARILSTYSADTFGVCSALYELGGMIVIHDPSGCNSTYTTHDEPRWFAEPSQIFISALTEQDAILGNDSKLIADIAEAAKDLRPRFICLIPSQIAHMIATDCRAICRILEKKTGIPAFTLPTNSMHLLRARHLLRPAEARRDCLPSPAGIGCPHAPFSGQMAQRRRAPQAPPEERQGPARQRARRHTARLFLERQHPLPAPLARDPRLPCRELLGHGFRSRRHPRLA